MTFADHYWHMGWLAALYVVGILGLLVVFSRAVRNATKDPWE
jgi:hypothetical protein